MKTGFHLRHIGSEKESSGRTALPDAFHEAKKMFLARLTEHFEAVSSTDMHAEDRSVEGNGVSPCLDLGSWLQFKQTSAHVRVDFRTVGLILKARMAPAFDNHNVRVGVTIPADGSIGWAVGSPGVVDLDIEVGLEDVSEGFLRDHFKLIGE